CGSRRLADRVGAPIIGSSTGIGGTERRSRTPGGAMSARPQTNADAANESPVTVERDGLVARVTLNRPSQFNAMSEALMESLQRALDEIAADRSVRVVVLGAAGKAFCAGHDLREMRAEPSHDYYRTLFA